MIDGFWSLFDVVIDLFNQDMIRIGRREFADVQRTQTIGVDSDLSIRINNDPEFQRVDVE